MNSQWSRVRLLVESWEDNIIRSDFDYDQFEEGELDPDHIVDYVLQELDHIVVIGCLTMDT